MAWSDAARAASAAARRAKATGRKKPATRRKKTSTRRTGMPTRAQLTKKYGARKAGQLIKYRNKVHRSFKTKAHKKNIAADQAKKTRARNKRLKEARSAAASKGWATRRKNAAKGRTSPKARTHYRTGMTGRKSYYPKTISAAPKRKSKARKKK